MQNPRASRHPLSVAIGDGSTTTVIISVIKNSIDDVGNRFETSMRMPRSSLRFTRGVLNFTHLIQVNERIEIGKVDAGECSTNWESFTFETLWRGCDAFYAAHFRGWVGADSRKHSYIGNGYGRHPNNSLLVLILVLIYLLHVSY